MAVVLLLNVSGPQIVRCLRIPERPQSGPFGPHFAEELLLESGITAKSGSQLDMVLVQILLSVCFGQKVDKPPSLLRASSRPDPCTVLSAKETTPSLSRTLTPQVLAKQRRQTRNPGCFA